MESNQTRTVFLEMTACKNMRKLICNQKCEGIRVAVVCEGNDKTLFMTNPRLGHRGSFFKNNDDQSSLNCDDSWKKFEPFMLR